MGKGVTGTMAEYVIKLGTQLDNQGLQQLLGYLDLSKLKALGLTAALTGLSTAIYKFASATAKKEYELQKLAKAQHKTTAAINAQNTALKSMGKTMQEVNKSKDLKEVYNDMKKFNEEMQLPNVDKAMEAVTKLRNAFWKLKDALNYVVQGIGRQVLINLEAPIKRITGGLDNISNWIKNNLNSVASKVGSYITALAKGLIGIGETVGKIFDWLNQMPASMKAIAGAIAGIVALLTMGPLGRILSVIMLIGDVIHDAENFQWNQQNKKTGEYIDPETGKPVEVKTAFGSIWEILFPENEDENSNEDKIREKSAAIAQRVFDGIIEGLANAINFLNRPDGMGFGEWFEKFTGPIGNALGGIVDWAKSSEGRQAIADVAKKLLQAVSSVLMVMGDLGVDLVGDLSKMLFQIFEGADWKEAWDKSGLQGFLGNKDNSFATGLATTLELAIAGVDVTTSLIGGVVAGYKKSRKEALEQLYKEAKANPDWKPTHDYRGDENGPLYTWLEEEFGNDKNLNSYITTDLQTDFNNMVNAILPTLFSGVELAGSVAGTVVQQILQGIATGMKDEGAKKTLTDSIDALGTDNDLFNAITLGFGTWFATGDFFAGIAAGMADAFAAYSKDGGDEKFQEDVQKIKEAILTLWYGAWELDKSTGKVVRNGRGLKGFFESLFGEGSLLKGVFDDLASKITTWLAPVATAVQNFFDGLWKSIMLKMPKFIQKALGFTVGSSVQVNDNNTFTITDDTGKSVTKGDYHKDGYAKSNIYGYYGGLYHLTDRGKAKFNIFDTIADRAGSSGFWEGTGDNEIYSEIDKALAIGDMKGLAYLFSLVNQLSEEFTSAKDGEGIVDTVAGFVGIQPATDEQRAAMNKFKDALNEYRNTGVVPEDWSWEGEGYSVPVTTELNNTIEEQLLQKKYSVVVEGKVRLTGLSKDDANKAANEINVKEGIEDIVVTEQEAYGGRIGSEGIYTVGEDGPEYIIPITKPGRAAELIRQMFNEMGSSAVSSIIGGLGLGESGTFGASLSSLETALSGISGGGNVTVNAPININVNSTGADAKDIGSSVYDLAERHLIKNVMGVYS